MTLVTHYMSESLQKTPLLMFGEKCKRVENARGKSWKMYTMGVVTHHQTVRVVTVTLVAKS